MPGSASIRTRFAPSPSGHLHVGGARTALYNWAYARGRGGRFILRIEDTDQRRSSDAASMAFLEDLRWLGIDWDEGPQHEGDGDASGSESGDRGPYLQSQRLDIYNEHIDRLIGSGHAYRAFETQEELDGAREKARAEKRAWRYRDERPALSLDQATIDRYVAEGRPHVVRFRVPDSGEVTVNDAILGEVTTSVDELDDFIIRKADGYPTYHFAVVVDDELMGITHVVRAQEHLSNTPRHVLLQEALGFRRPAYAHLSVITNPDGSKMSKRDKDKVLRAAMRDAQQAGAGHGEGAPGGTPSSVPVQVREDDWAWWLESEQNQLPPDQVEALAQALGIHLPEIDVDDFRREGYLPEVMVNYLALLGWSPGRDVEKFDMKFFVERFDFDRAIKSAAKFDREKLLAFNLDALQALEPPEFVKRLRAHAERYHPEFIERLDGGSAGEAGGRFDHFARANQVRSKTLEDPFRGDRFFIVPDDEIVYEHSRQVRKALLGGESGGTSGTQHLEALLPLLRDVQDWTVESLEQAVTGYAEEHAGGKLGKVAQPLRIAVTGSTISPAIFDTLVILGRESTLNRIQHCLAHREMIATQ